ncbi:MAG TPA: Ig-like domain-containing protein [Kofleriaceae bacterium]|nr:Ig-like domain-containing protein [Kofleriaceae bacterium]
MRLFASAIVCCVLWPPRAHACEPSTGIADRDILPVDGSTNVPINVRLALSYYGYSGAADLADVQLQPIGGQPVAVTAQRGITNHPSRSLVFIRPTAALAANTTFQILTRIPTVPCGSASCVSSTYSVATTFTTGSGPDTVAPMYAGLSSVSTSEEICDSSACCGPDRAVHYNFPLGTPTDDVAYAGVNLYRVGTGLVAELTHLSGFELCSGQPSGGGPIGDFMAPTGIFYAHAVDLAGNEDSNMQLVAVPVTCAGGRDGPGSSSPGSSSPGCSCSVAPRSDLLLIFLAVLLLRRRRWPR